MNDSISTTLSLIITSPKSVMTYERLKSVTVPGMSGLSEIMPAHAEAFIHLKAGTIKMVSANGKVESIQIIGGECHVKKNKISIVL